MESDELSRVDVVCESVLCVCVSGECLRVHLRACERACQREYMGIGHWWGV